METCATQKIKRVLVLCINGILNWPGSADNWNGKAVSNFHRHTPYVAEKIEYFTGVLLTRVWQGKRIIKLQKTLMYYANDPFTDWQIILVGHSNGCNVICGALKRLKGFPVKQVHLIAPACHHDFEKNGLQFMQKLGLVDRVFIYSGGRDIPLKISGAFGGLGAVFGLGALGHLGPLNHVPEKTTIDHNEEFGHSDFFHDGYFETMMAKLRANIQNGLHPSKARA